MHVYVYMCEKQEGAAYYISEYAFAGVSGKKFCSNMFSKSKTYPNYSLHTIMIQMKLQKMSKEFQLQ